MNSMELPLVIFTVLSQAAIGLVALSAVRQWATERGPVGNVRGEWLAAAGLLAVGLLASLFHLGHPFGAPNAIKHLGSAWLSREALAMGLLLAVVVAGALTAREKASTPLALLAVLAGILALLATGMTYAPPSFPALSNGLPFVFFLITAAVLGAGLASYFAPAERMGLVRAVLAGGLLVGLVVWLVAPCVWLSGGAVMEMTGRAWLSSPLYWARLTLGLALPLAVVWRSRDIPAWLPLLLLAGEILGRMVFFAETAHTAANIGGLY